jgi:hypothetical protein
MEEVHMIDYQKFKSASEFFHAARGEGIQFPVSTMSMIEKTMRDLDLEFANAFDVVLNSDAIIPSGDYAFIFNLCGSLTDPLPRFQKRRRDKDQESE